MSETESEAAVRRFQTAVVTAERERIIAGIGALKLNAFWGNSYMDNAWNAALDAAIKVVKGEVKEPSSPPSSR